MPALYCYCERSVLSRSFSLSAFSSLYTFPPFARERHDNNVPGRRISGCPAVPAHYAYTLRDTIAPAVHVFSASITKLLWHLTASVAHVCLLPRRFCRPVACCCAPDFVLHITVIGSSTERDGPRSFRTSAPAVWNRLPSHLRTEDMHGSHEANDTCLHAPARWRRRYEHLDKWTYRLIDRKSNKSHSEAGKSVSARNKFVAVTTTARRKQWMRRWRSITRLHVGRLKETPKTVLRFHYHPVCNHPLKYTQWTIKKVTFYFWL